MLHDEFEFFVENQPKLVNIYNGRFIVLKNQEVIGDYTTQWEAYIETQKKHKLGTFLIQKCEPGPSAYTAYLHAQMAIA